MKIILRESNLRKGDIKTISYVHESCRGLAPDSYYEEIIDKSNVQEILENIKGNKLQTN